MESIALGATTHLVRVNPQQPGQSQRGHTQGGLLVGALSALGVSRLNANSPHESPCTPIPADTMSKLHLLITGLTNSDILTQSRLLVSYQLLDLLNNHYVLIAARGYRILYEGTSSRAVRGHCY